MKLLRIILGITQTFVAVMALPAGLMMMFNPETSGIGLPPETLVNSPFISFFIPGLALFALIGLGSGIAATLSFRNSRHYGPAGIALGTILALWILIQVNYTGWLFFLQPLFLGLGLIEIVLGGIRWTVERGQLRI